MDSKKKQCMSCMEFYDSSFDVCPHCGHVEASTSKELLHIAPGKTITDPSGNAYLVGNSIGYGGFGITYVGYDIKLKRKVAIKEYLPSEFATRALNKTDVMVNSAEKKKQQFESGKSKFLQEAQKLAQVSNVDGIVHIYDSFEANNTAYIIMEYLEGETLATFLEHESKLTEEQANDIIIPVLQALDEVHSHGIIHRDIAPDNIFLAKDSKGNAQVKLIDFGASRYASTSHSKSLTVLIKPGYSPAEQYQSNGEQGTFTDVYAAGAVLYRMITGVQPVDAFERRTMIQSGKRDPLKDPTYYNTELSENFENALMNAMNVRVEDRSATASEFLEELISFEPVKRRGVTIRKIDFLKWPLWAKIAVPTAIVSAITLLILFITGVISFKWGQREFDLPEDMAIVPDLTASDVAMAQERIAEIPLQLSNSGAIYAPGIPENVVQSQDTPIGTIVMKNSVISVVVSTGKEEYLMPDVTGMTEEYAIRAIECMGLTVKTETAKQSGLSNGCVVSQDIKPYSKVITGDTVTLKISEKAKATGTETPDFKGMTYEEALKAATEAGVDITVCDKKFSKECATTEVLSQEVDEDTVKINLAIAWHEFTMPNLLYKSKDDAVQLLKNIGISSSIVEENNDVVAIGLVLSQNIEKDKKVQPGAKAEITVSKGGKPFAMPNVVDQELSTAKTKLLDEGLSVTVEYDYDENVEEGHVISQSIKAKADVTRGENVTLIVCSTDGLTAVANVSGMSSNKAKATLEKQGFGVVISEAESSSDQKGKVISQLPAAGTMQPEGKTIALTVGTGPKAKPAPAAKPTSKPTPAPTAKPTSKPTPAPTAKPTPKQPGEWSTWQTSLPSNVTSSKYDIENKTQYRKKTRETTTSTNSSMSGWTQYDSETSFGDYGSWSSWSNTAVSESDTRQVETKNVAATYKTQYNYSRYTEKTGGHGWNGPTQGNWGGHYCQYYQERGWTDAPLEYAWSDSGYSVYGYSGNYWYNQQTRQTQVTAAYTQYRYRDRSKTTTYYYERWSDWSSYGDSPISSSNNVKVDTRTVYRYRTKGS